MPFKGISYLELWQTFCSAEHNHLCNFSSGYNQEQFCEIILNLFTPVVQKEMSYLELWQPSCSVEQTHICNFERGHHQKHLCEVI